MLLFSMVTDKKLSNSSKWTT